MKKQVITQGSILNFLKKGFKNKIVEIMEKAPFSKLMICTFLLIPEPMLSECFNELLEEKKIVEKGKHYCKVSKTEQPFYVAEKLLPHLNSLQNDK